MAQLTNTLINGDLRVTGTIYGSHSHGNITNDGTLQTTDVTIASGDKLVITDSSDSSKVARASISFDGSTATKALTQKGTWETFNNYSHPTTSGNKHIPSGGSSGQFLGWDSDGTAKWVANPNTDSKIDATASTANENYKLLAAAAAPSTGTTNTTAVYDADVTLNPSTNTISANISGKASLLAGTYSGNGGQLAPSAITKGTVRAAMMNAPKGLTAFNTFCDCILMDTYTGNDVPYVTGLGISRNNGKPKMYIFNGAQGNTTTWANEQEVYTTATTVAIANGGTGATDAATARSNLGAAASTHTHGKDVVGGTDYSIEVSNTDTSAPGWISVVEVDSSSSNYKSVLVRGKLIIGNGNWSQVYDSEMEFQAVLLATTPAGSCVVATPFYKSSGGQGSSATYAKASPSDYIRIARSSSNKLELQVNFVGIYNRYAVHYTVQSDTSYVANTTVKAGMSSPAATIAPTYDYCAGKVLGTGGSSTTPVYVDSSGCVQTCSGMAPAIASQTSFNGVRVLLGSAGGTPQAALYLYYYSDSNNGHMLVLGDEDASPRYSNNYSTIRFNRGTQKYTELRSANTSNTSNVLYLPTNPGRLEVTLSNQFSYNSSTQFYKLAEIAASSDSNASCLNIKGMCGGYQANAQHEFSLAIGVRGSVGFDYTVLSGTYNNIIKFVLAKNTDNSYTLYIRVDAGQYGKFALTAIPGPNVSMVYDGTSVAFSGTAVADSGTDTYKKYAVRGTGGNSTTPVYVDSSGCVQTCGAVGQANKLTDRTNSGRYVQVSYYGSGTITGSNSLTHLAGFFKPDGDSSSVICDVTPAKLAAYLSGSDVNVALQNGTYTSMTVGKANKVGNYSIVVGALGTDTSTLYFV